MIFSFHCLGEERMSCLEGRPQPSYDCHWLFKGHGGQNKWEANFTHPRHIKTMVAQLAMFSPSITLERTIISLQSVRVRNEYSFLIAEGATDAHKLHHCQTHSGKQFKIRPGFVCMLEFTTVFITLPYWHPPPWDLAVLATKTPNARHSAFPLV